MRRIPLSRPFTAGMVTDQPAHALGPQHSQTAQDGYSPSGIFKQRGGWAYDGTTADVADNLVGVYRAKFVLADVTRTLTGDDDGDLFIHNDSAAGTAIFAGSVEYLPRCVYRDELIFCAQDGATPLRRYSGVAGGSYTNAASVYQGSESRITASSGNYGSPEVGMYFYGRTIEPPITGVSYRVAEVNSTTSLTIEDMYSTFVDENVENPLLSATGSAWGGVSVYRSGTISISVTAVTGIGTKWTTGGWGSVVSDSGGSGDLLLFLTAPGEYGAIPVANVTDDTSISIGGASVSVSNLSHDILRRCPFKDAEAHKESLWGAGVAQYPSRVYVGPPGWNPSFPPGFTVPFDPGAAAGSSNPNDFLLDFIDVPSAVDSDPIVAILSSPNPLLVLKRKAVYGVYGSYPNFTVDMIADGIGCIDVRSAWSYDEGQFWAGEGGIYWYTGGRIVDLTAGKINREWRALTRDFDYGTLDYCSLSVSQGHLVVHITTAGGTVQRTYICDLRDASWQSRISNFTPRFMSTSRIPGEAEKLLAVANDRQGRVIDFAPAIDGSGTAKDDAGSAPRLGFTSTTALGQAEGIEGNTTLVDLDIHANVYDAGAAAATVLAISTSHGGGTANQADSSKTLDPINSDSADRIDRHSRRIGRKGRLHSLTGSVTTLGTDTAATKVEVHQIVATVRDHRRRS